MGWLLGGSPKTPQQKRQKQARLDRAAKDRNRTIKGMKAAEKADKKRK